MAHEIELDVLRVLSGLDIDGQVVRIREQLERKLYVRVNKVLEALGGKWTSGKVKGHVFQDDPSERLDGAIVTRRYEKPTRNGFFPTPEAVADEMMEALALKSGMEVLEPSAGDGALVRALLRVTPADCICAVELREDLAAKLRDEFAGSGLTVTCQDFLAMHSLPAPIFDRVLMNPPFELGQDVDHVMHAFGFLKPGGRLVSVMSAGVTFRQEKKYQRFREMAIANVVMLPDDSFKPSGTGVRTVYVVIDK